MAYPGSNIAAGGKFTSLLSLLLSLKPTHLSELHHWGAGSRSRMTFRLTEPGPSGQTGSCLPRWPPCLRWHSSRACWGCCQCSQTRCPCHPRHQGTPAHLQWVTSPIKLRRTVSGSPSLRISGTWTKDSRVAHPNGEGNTEGTRAVVAPHVWTGHELNRTEWVFIPSIVLTSWWGFLVKNKIQNQGKFWKINTEY